MQCDSLFHSNYRVWNRIWAQRKRTTHIKSPQHTLRVLGNRMPNFHRTRDVFQPFSQCFSTILQSFLFVLFLTHFNDFLQYFDDGRIPQASCQHETWVRLVARRPIRWLRSIRNVQIWNLNFEIGNFWKMQQKRLRFEYSKLINWLEEFSFKGMASAFQSDWLLVLCLRFSQLNNNVNILIWCVLFFMHVKLFEL